MTIIKTIFSSSALRKIFNTNGTDINFFRTDWDKPEQKAAVTLLTTAICLLIVYWMKNSGIYLLSAKYLITMFSVEPEIAIRRFLSSQWLHLSYKIWWVFWILLALVVIPCLVIRFIFSDRIRDYGFQFGNFREHIPLLLVLSIPILIAISIASNSDRLASYYPMYKFANRSWLDLISWELIYLAQFVAIEFFYRGFMIHALRPAFGINAVMVMVIPYMMIHFGKPVPEALAALFGGIFLGFLALHGRTIWSGFLLHAMVALSMDFTALFQTKGLPQQLLP